LRNRLSSWASGEEISENEKEEEEDLEPRIHIWIGGERCVQEPVLCVYNPAAAAAPAAVMHRYRTEIAYTIY
jgi:hypothetical protein